MKGLQITCEDCMELMERYPDKYFDLAIIDPPYNIGKAYWDKWPTNEDYYEYIKLILLSLRRVMRDNSSVYFFHNDFPQLANIQSILEKETDYILRQFIVWNKRFNGSRNKGFFDGYVEVDGLRNYQKLAEYICFYTFQDEAGLSKVNKASVYPIRDYIRQEIIKAKGRVSFKEINKVLGTATNGGGVASAVLSLNKREPAMITREHYQKLREWINDSKEHEYLRKEYEDLRKEYEDLRYYFNNQKKHHSVWDIDIEKKETDHITEKPVSIYKTILKHSGRDGAKIIDPFLGSGSIAIACYDMGFELTACELDPDYYRDAMERIRKHTEQQALFTPQEMYQFS